MNNGTVKRRWAPGHIYNQMGQAWIGEPGSWDASGIIEPDTILPSQWGSRSVSEELEPVLRLARRIIEDAIQEATGGGATVSGGASKEWGRKARAMRMWNARRWIELDEPDHIFSFVSIARLFGWDPDKVRQRILGPGFVLGKRP